MERMPLVYINTKEVLVAIGFVLVVLVQPALGATPNCGPHEEILSELKAKYKEKPASWGLTNVGALLEVLVSEKGTWTVLVTIPYTRIACVVAAGTDWVGDDFIPCEYAKGELSAIGRY